MVVVRHEGRTSLLVRGPETLATTVDCPPQGEWFAIRFKLGSFMPLFPPGTLRDRNDVLLPSATSRSFWLHGSAWEYPDFENAETFAQRLVRGGLVSKDRLITAVLEDRPTGLTKRTEQRRFLQVTGLTLGAIQQIERARYATNLLRQGGSLTDVAYQAGYYDQAHFTRSLKRWIGQTPARLVQAREQLSFLYNTASPAPLSL